MSIIACRLQRIDTLADAVRILLRAAALENHADSLWILNVLRCILTAAEQTPIAEDLRTAQGDEFCLYAAHRQTCHSTIPLVGLGEVVGVDKRNEFINEHSLKLLGGKAADGAKLHIVGEAIGHNDDERIYLTLCDEVVHDDACMSLTAPAGLVLTPSVLQIEHRETLLLCLGTLANKLAIGWWQIDHSSLHLALAGRIVENLLNCAMRYIGTEGVEVLIGSWYLDATLPTA